MGWTRWLAGAMLALAPVIAGAAKGDAGLVPVPPDSRLVGTAAVDEIRQFPEQQGAKKPMERVVGVSAIDRVFEAQKGYQDAVAFFDQQLKQGGFDQLARVVTPTSTSWVVKRPDGRMANVMVRNTTPVTIEVVEAVAAETTAPPPPSGK